MRWVPAGVPLFVRASGKPLTDGIPGFFTVDGFHKVLLPSLGGAAKSVVSESWVLGNRVAFDPNGPQMQALERDVVTLYEADYVPTWDLMLADLNVVPLRSLSQAAQDLYILASPESPMRSCWQSISRQLTLSVPPGGAQAAAAPDAPASNTQQRLQAVFGASQPASAAAPSAARPRDRRTLSGTARSCRRAGRMRRSIWCCANSATRSSRSPSWPRPWSAPAPRRRRPGGIDPLLALKADAARQPQPLGRWLTEIATSAIALRSGDPRQQLATIFNASGGPAEICAAVVNGRYPFAPNATDDAPIADFARLFAPGAALDGFVNTLLRRYVDTSGKTWRLISADAAIGTRIARGPRAVPARRRDPRCVLCRWRDAAALPARHHASQRRCGDAAGDARSGRHCDCVYARRAAIDPGDVAEFLVAADHAAGVRSAD